MNSNKQPGLILQPGFYILLATIALYGCNSSSGSTGMPENIPSLPVMSVSSMPASTYQEFSASLEGTHNVEIRPQVDGYLDKIYIDEGAHVTKGQLLFKVNDQPLREQLNNAQAGLLAAKANLAKAELDVNKLTPLVQNNVISDVQLKAAQSAYEAAKANVSLAQSQVGNAQINFNYSLIKAPVTGYIGRIPFKTGSLVTKGNTEPLTLISEINNMYAYFSMSENDFLQFGHRFKGNTIEEKIKQLPPVELVLADNSVFPQKGKVEIVQGQFDRTMGSISFRAVFANAGGLLRSGNTGKVRIAQTISNALIVPQEATFEIQDKVFVFALADSNKVISKPIGIAGKTTNYYFVNNGLTTGEKIVLTGTGNLRNGMVIAPQAVSADSVLKSKPL